MYRILNAGLMIAVVTLTLVATWLMDGHNGINHVNHNIAKPETRAREQAPDITLTDLNNNQIKLHDYKRKVVLLNFWATWCAPCIVEFQQFIKLAQVMPDDLVILAISVDDDKTNIGKFLKRHVPGHERAKNVRIFWDQNKSISQDLFQTVRVPETIIITPDMTMARKVAGLSIKWDSEETKKYLSDLVAD